MKCETRFPLWDALERKLPATRCAGRWGNFKADDLAKLTTWRKGKLLVLDVGERITSANQKWIEVPGYEERFVLLAMHQTLVERGLCLRQSNPAPEGPNVNSPRCNRGELRGKMPQPRRG